MSEEILKKINKEKNNNYDKNKEINNENNNESKFNSKKNSDKEKNNKKKRSNQKDIAHELAKKQREIGVAEFFARNKHLLGFDNPRKALLTTVKEAVDNSIDACEEAGILPEVIVEVIDMGKNRFRVIVEDNGPGIIKEQIPKIFAKLLYGSKFHSRKQQRGQQGIGISASVMYAQLTTGRPAKIISKTKSSDKAQYLELQINTSKNEPEILFEEKKEWTKEHGTRIELDLEGSYQKGSQSIDEYLKQTAVVNPHVTIIYVNPKAEQYVFARVSDKLPIPAKEIKPHPLGINLGTLLDMLSHTNTRTLQQFLQIEFSRVSNNTAKQICEEARLRPNMKPSELTRDHAESLIEAFKKVKLMTPITDCLSPITEELLEKGLKKEINAEFYAAISRPPIAVNGNPLQVEAAIAYGGLQKSDSLAKLMRFSNRVPLLYQQGACAITKGVTSVNWKSYGLQQPGNGLPLGPLTIAVHIASVWVPYTSESKEAIAHYDEIIKEVRLAIQDLGRKLGKYLSKKQRVKAELKKRSFIEKYIPKLSEAIVEILNLDRAEKISLEIELKKLLEKSRGEVKEIKFDPKKNTEFDESFSRIGSEEEKTQRE